MQFTQIKETCLYVQDLARTSAFYAGKLGLPILAEAEDRHIFFRAGNSVLLCFNAQKTREGKDLPPHFGEGQLHLALECETEDYVRWKAKLRQVGIPIEYEHAWPQGRKSCYFRDPDHHLLEIVMSGMWG